MIISDEIASGRRLLSQGQASAAQHVAERVLTTEPTSEAAWILLIDSWSARGSLSQAVEAAVRGLRATPHSNRIQARLMTCRLHLGEFVAAGQLAETVWSRRPNDIETLTMIGQVAAALERHDLARSAFEAALETRPGDPQLLFNLATSIRNFGDFERAEALYDQVISRRPDDWEAYKNRSELRRQTPQRNHVAELQHALARTGKDWRGAVMLHYALGKECEDLERAEAAFEAYDAGARLRRRHMNYDVRADLQRLARIQATFSATWLRDRPPGLEKAGPIFVFGLPRSGSTLLERMLGAHSAIIAAGELQDFGIAVMSAANLAGGGPARDLIEQSAKLDPKKLGAAYIASTAARVPRSEFFIDKLPGNFLYAGLIAAALPKAKMIHIHRDSRDAGFAMYKTLFKQAYPFSYDLPELGRYIAAYQALMDHWRSVLGDRLCDVGYEELVGAPEEVLARVLDYCGLAFEPQCLAFHQSPQASSTASSVQVRRPIYKSSLETWRRHERALAPLIEALG